MKTFSSVYYRYIFLRDNRIARIFAALVGSPDVPSREMWDSQYKMGDWERLNDLSEQAHNGVLLSYIAYLRPDSSVLEIGCGEGGLLRRLRQAGYRHYVGIDISEVAIAKSRQYSDRKTIFLVGDAERYVPDAPIDVAVLNESIYYFAQPIVTLQRYANHLMPSGLFVISLFENDQTRPIRRCLKSTFPLVDETTVSNSKGTWHCLVLAPRTATSANVAS